LFYKLRVYLRELKKSSEQIKISLKEKKCDDLYYLSKLAKCCHILDKGCYTVPFEKKHSLSIYNEAKRYIEKIDYEKNRNDSCYNWCVKKIKRYEEMQEEMSSPNLYVEPVVYKDSSVFDDFINSFISVRRFSDKTISNDIIKQSIKTAQSASSSCFRQTPRCYAIKSFDLIKKMTPSIAGLTGFSNGVPLLFCITSDLRSYDCVDRDLAYIDSTLFSQNLVLSLRAKNIYSVFLNFQQASKTDISIIKEYLKIPEYEKIIIFIACGYSDYISEKPQRLDFEKVGKIYE